MKPLFNILYGPPIDELGEEGGRFCVRPTGVACELWLEGRAELRTTEHPWVGFTFTVDEIFSTEGRYNYARRHEGNFAWSGDQADLPLARLHLEPVTERDLDFWGIQTVGDLGKYSELSICTKLYGDNIAVHMTEALARRMARRFVRLRDRLLRELEIDYPFDDDPNRSRSEQEFAAALLR